MATADTLGYGYSWHVRLWLQLTRWAMVMATADTLGYGYS